MSEEQEEVQDQSTESAPTDEPASAPEVPPAPEAAPAAEAAPAGEPAPVTDAKDVEEGKAFAVLSYALGLVGIPFFLVPLIMRNNEFSLYHAKQCLVLWIAGIVGSVASSVLLFVCVGGVLGIAVLIAWVVLSILGIMASSKGETKPLMVIGQWGEDWFKGIQKV